MAFPESQGKTHLAGITMKEVLAAAQPAKAAAMAMKLAFVHLVENSAEFTNVLKYNLPFIFSLEVSNLKTFNFFFFPFVKKTIQFPECYLENQVSVKPLSWQMGLGKSSNKGIQKLCMQISTSFVTFMHRKERKTFWIFTPNFFFFHFFSFS